MQLNPESQLYNLTQKSTENATPRLHLNLG